MSVYFITARQVDRVKIGFSVDPKRRLKELQTGMPFALTLDFVIDGDLEQERALHRRFSHLRVNNEWFRLRGEIDFFIATAKSIERERRAARLNESLRRAREGVCGDHADPFTDAAPAPATGQNGELSGGVAL